MGICKKQNPFRGVVTVSEKGQIVIPAGLMRELGIERGAQLIIVKREDEMGFTAIKSEAIQDTLTNLINNNPV